jgi:hypothetical protein
VIHWLPYTHIELEGRQFVRHPDIHTLPNLESSRYWPGVSATSVDAQEANEMEMIDCNAWTHAPSETEWYGKHVIFSCCSSGERNKEELKVSGSWNTLGSTMSTLAPC